jgi:hypothetical protein
MSVYKGRQDVKRRRLQILAKRYREDICFRLSINLRGALSGALRRYRASKKVSSILSLGCTIPELVVYIESKFLVGMSWDNHGRGENSWSIDHIKPLFSFKLF